MTKRIKRVIFSLLLILSLVATLVLQENVEVKAASPKTVRVATEKQLKAALKNSKVGTIVLRTLSNKDITIKSGKAKKKKIIVDAPFATVTNTARFKKVEVLRAENYIEAVSGNTIKLSSNVHMVVAEGVSVKKLVSGDVPVYYDIQKNGSIKSIRIDNKTHKSNFDKETRTLTFDTMGSWTNHDLDDETTENPERVEYSIHYTAELDESGRILRSTYKDGAADQYEEYKYDEDGNCIKWKHYDVRSGEWKLTSYGYYVYEGNSLTQETYYFLEYGGLTNKKIYGEDGRLVEFNQSSPYYSKDAISTYDDDGLLVCEDTTETWFSEDGEVKGEQNLIYNYTYDKDGFLLNTEIDYNGNGRKYIVACEYDESHNLVHETRFNKTLMRDGSELIENKIEYRYEYDELGLCIDEMLVDFD